MASTSRLVGLARSISTLRVVRRAASELQRRHYNFGSSSYVSCFGVEKKDEEHFQQLRKETVDYITEFDKSEWYKRPVCTVINGVRYEDGDVVATPDSFGVDVGEMVLAKPDVVDKVIEHARRLKARPTTEYPSHDLRTAVRKVEAKMMGQHAAALVGNQAMDFHKQDGITEIEESLEANQVERNLNDKLFEDEVSGKIQINRYPAIVGCVSNFSNFLDLCRKVIRNIELGVPVIVLSRSNTTQHMFRWFEILVEELAVAGVDASMLTYASCTIEEQRRIMAALSDSPLYLTGSRPVAEAIKDLVPATFSSTGGPNTMITLKTNENIFQAIRDSVAIENSGQCTAMRHLVAPGLNEADINSIFSNETIPEIGTSVTSLKTNGFAAFFSEWGSSFDHKGSEGYKRHNEIPLAYKVDDKFPREIDEGWRRLFLDVTKVNSAEEMVQEKFCDDLSKWLVQEQPITLAINCDDAQGGYPVTSKLFERTCQVVYSIGTEDNPALTCQARPQEGEIFGEFAPRRDLSKYTKFPVVVPSPTPGYHAGYTSDFLVQQSKENSVSAAEANLRDVVATLPNWHVASGYMHILADYLKDACGPKEGFEGPRTKLWGLQRPPLNTITEIRIDASTDIPAALIYMVPFAVTNASEQLSLSIDPGASEIDWIKATPNIHQRVESATEFVDRVAKEDPWNVIHPDRFIEYPLAGHFTSLVFPLGHIKSTTPDDKTFIDHFKKSPKWLRAV